MDLFRDGTPDTIAARLEASVDSPNDRPMLTGPSYKGVTFPSDPEVSGAPADASSMMLGTRRA